jgi:spermidine synthase
MGLPGTIIMAGIMNIILAIIFWQLAANNVENPSEPQPPAKDIIDTKVPVSYRLLLFISLATGIASFIYEIGWIRMLSLVLGSSTHAFELMLSAFIFGLAFGGLWIQKRIDRTANPVHFLAMVQVIMGLMAVATLPLYGQSFGTMKWLMSVLPKTNSGYFLFNLSSNAIAMAIMLPATLCAGMTLPLITYALIRGGNGERSIGAVYAMNTVGAIIGVFFAVHVGMPALGLKNLITSGAALDMSLGILLLWLLASPRQTNWQATLASVVCICIISSTIFLVQFDPYKMISGVYRHGELIDPGNSKLVFHKDGKTATVSVDLRRSGLMSIRTNGKTDAGINVFEGKDAFGEESTMTLAAVIPMAYHPQAKTAANIGLGSGLTTHTLLSNPLLKQVNTIEIEKEIVEAAKSFGHRVEHVYHDHRSVIYIDDAKTFFSSHKSKYDIIISEPSNPWVSGVAGLFSVEFYRSITGHLNEDGIFVQWMQLYEIDNNLVTSVMKALSPHFHDYLVYVVDSFDIIILAKRTGTFSRLDKSVLSIPEITEALKRVNIRSIQDMETRKIGDKKMLDALFNMSSTKANSDFFPVLDQNAVRTRFLRSSATNLTMLGIERLPLTEMLVNQDGNDMAANSTYVTLSPGHGRTWCVNMAMSLRDYIIQGRFVSYGHSPTARMLEETFRLKLMYSGGGDVNDPNRRNYLFHAAEYTVPYLRPEECSTIWKVLESGAGAASLSPIERQYVDLFKAIGDRNAGNMAFMARTILETEQDITLGRMKYVLAAGMLGNIAMGKPESARQLWLKYRPTVFQDKQPNLLFRFLEAKSLERNQ